jgi:hypothetical protein
MGLSNTFDFLDGQAESLIRRRHYLGGGRGIGKINLCETLLNNSRFERLINRVRDVLSSEYYEHAFFAKRFKPLGNLVLEHRVLEEEPGFIQNQHGKID